MDIRNFFKPLGSSSGSKKESTAKEKKRKKANVDSDDEEPLPLKSKKNKSLAPDSDDEIFTKPSATKKVILSNKKSPSKSSKSLDKFKATKTPPKLKPASVNEFFGPSATQEKSKKPKKEIKNAKEIHSDDEFEKAFSPLDNEDFKPIKRKSQEENPGSTSKHSRPSLGLSAKLAAKIKDDELRQEEDTSKKSKAENNNDVKPIKKEEALHSKITNGHKSEKSAPIKKENSAAKQMHSKDTKSPKAELSISPSKVFNDKKGITPTKQSTMQSNDKGSASKNVAKVKEIDDSLIEEIPITPEDKKKQNVAAYRRFLQRGGPKNPGTKPIPEGKPGCLSGLTFVITGVLDSLDREEVTDIAKKYNAKVTTNVSKNTSYLIVGEDPGSTKIKKAEQIGTPILDEDGFLNLISSRSDSSTAPTKGKSEKNKPKKNVAKKLQHSSNLEVSPSRPPVYSKSPSAKRSDSHSSSSTLSEPSLPSANISKQNFNPKASSASAPSSSLLWVDKYKPSLLKNIIGQQGEASNAKKLLNWLKNWFSNQSGNKKLIKPSPWAKNNDGSYFKAALLSGPPGVGKTTTAFLACKELGFDAVEMNASVTRSKRCLQEEISELLTNQSLKGFSSGSACFMTQNHVLLMDEVDGMAGNEDRGGVQELIQLIKNSKIPIICMCNDRNHPKIRSLANYCYDLRFYKPRIEQIRGAMLSVCFKEGIKLKPEALDQIILGAKHDIRQVLHHLSVWSADQKNLDPFQVKKDAQSSKKDFKMGPWDVCQKVFSESEHKEMSIHDKVGLFFQDYSIGPLFVQENYLKASPHCARGNPKKLLEQLAKTASVLADGDLVEHAIRKQNSWSLLPVQALFSSVCPGEYMAGHLSAQIEFPRWLGNNSRAKKFDRLAQELHTHMRLRISGSKLDVAMEYSSPLQHKILKPLIRHGSEGVEEAVSAMTSHDLLREDLESVLELSKWPHTKDLMTQIESKVKAAFTRGLNKDSHMNPYAVVSISKSKRGANAADEIEEGDNVEESEDEEDISKDAMISQGKKKTSNASGATSSNTSKTKGGKGSKKRK